MDSHQDAKYLETIIKITERAVEEFPDFLEKQLESLKAELKLLTTGKKKKHDR